MLGLVVVLISRFDPNPPAVEGPTIVVPTSEPRPVPLPVVPVPPSSTRPPTTTAEATTSRPPAASPPTAPPSTTTTTRPPTTTTTRPCPVALLGRCLTP